MGSASKRCVINGIGKMKNFFAIKFNLDSGVGQAELMPCLKGLGAEVIQTSDGLGVRTEKSQSDLQKIWADKKWNLNLSSLDSNNAELSSDIKAFLNS
jgi:hypothetical protein